MEEVFQTGVSEPARAGAGQGGALGQASGQTRSAEQLGGHAGLLVFDQSEVARANPKFELFVVEPELVQDRGQPVVVVDDAIDRVVREFGGY